MRIYENTKEMHSEEFRNLQEFGITRHNKSFQDKVESYPGEFDTKEVQGTVFMVEDTSDKDEMVKAAGGNLDWCYADFEERISKDEINPGEAYKLREEWSEFVHDGKFGYTYNERIRTQLQKTIELLKWDKDTRQAVLTIYEGDKDSENRGGKVRVPCSMFYQFQTRTEGPNTFVDIIYTMRSNDFLTHFIYDIWMAAALKDYVAKELGMRPGRLIYFSGSLHYYLKDAKHVM